MNIIKQVSSLMCVSEDDIHILKDNIGGMTNHSCLISIKGVKYVVREPGVGSNNLVNRQHEASVIKSIMQHKSFNTPDMYEDNNFIKVSQYIEDSHTANSLFISDITKSLQAIHTLHLSGIKVDFEYNLKENILMYEALMKHSQFSEYEEVKSNCIKLLDIVNNQLKPAYTFTHVDFNPDNTLITKDCTYLIDFEYSAMQDPDLDFAMWCIYCMYSDENIDNFIDLCISEKVNIEHNVHLFKAKIYAYIGIAGLLWSNWCEYKKLQGQDLGEYAMYQFMAAKKYSVKALHTLKELGYDKN